MKKINLFIKTNSKGSTIETILPYYKNESSNYFFENKFKSYHFLKYNQKKNKSYIYKVIFLVLSGIFSSLALYTYYSSLNWACFLVLGDHTAAKNILCFASFFFALSSFLFGIFINPIKEVIWEIKKKNLEKAKKIRNKQIDALDKINLNFNDIQKEKKLISLAYEELQEIVNEEVEASFFNLKKIYISEDLTELEKEKNSNQLLSELETKLDQLIENFKNNL